MNIMSNIAAINAHRNLKINNEQRAKTMEKLSTGYRINRAADDAAGLAISEKMKYQINGTQQAMRNVQDGISLIQTAEGGMNEIHAMLQRMNVLVNQASNGTYNNDDRVKLDLEFQQLKREINGIAEGTNFNGIKLLSGGLNSKNFTIYKGENINSLNYSTLIGNSDNIHNAQGITIIQDINDELTVKFNGVAYSIKIAAGHYNGSSTALYNDINSKLTAIGAPVHLSDVHSNWDDTHMRTLLTSKIVGDHTIEVEGTAFNEIFAQETNYSGTHQVWGREADFSVGYTVKAGENDTLNFIENGISKTIILNEGSYSRDELITEINSQFTSAGANITASMSAAVGVNVSTGPGNTHYILRLQHDFSNSKDAIQLVSGNALSPLFMRSTHAGDVWTPQSTSYLKTDIDISNGLTIEEGNTEWEFIVDEDITKTINLNTTTYSSTELINALNTEFERISAGIIAIEENGALKFDREMNGSSYTIDGFNIKSDLATELKLQVGYNSEDIFRVELSDMRLSKLGISNTSLSTQESARLSISRLEKAVEIVSSERAKFGAYQNALEHISNNLQNSTENLSAAHSRIRDADMATEMTQLTKSQIIAEAGTSMLAQANSLPQNILKLLV